MKPGRHRIPRCRALCNDVLHYAKKVPTCAHSRTFNLANLQSARQSLPSRISWTLLFIKAFAIVAEKNPQLKQSFIKFPWNHIFQHKSNVAMLAIQREFEGQQWLLWGRFQSPESTPLPELQKQLDRYQTGAFKETFKQQWQLSLFPTVLRRLFWTWNLNFAAEKRAKRTGTFGLSTLAAKGVEIQHPPAYLTSCLTYGPFDSQGQTKVTIAYDHRLMDGSFIADVLVELEQTLNNEISQELNHIAITQNKIAA